MTEPPNTEALLQRLRDAGLSSPLTLEEIDAIAELRAKDERGLAQVQRLMDRAEAAEAELERVRAERDMHKSQREKDIEWAERTQARLDRAVEALREIRDDARFATPAQTIARAALAEIEESGRSGGEHAE